MNDENNPNNDDYENLRAEINKIRQDYNRAKRLLKAVEEFGEKFKDIKNLLDDEEDGVNKNFEWIKRKVGEIEELNTNTKETVLNISANLQKVKTQVESMQTAYSEFSEIKGKVIGRSNEIDQLRESAQGLRDDIESTKKNAQEILEKIKTLFADAQEKINNMQSAYTSFLQIKSKIEDPNSGLEAIFNVAQNLQKKSQSLFQEIQSFRDESSKLLTEIRNNKNQSDKLQTKITKTFDFTESKRKEIEKITGLVIDSSFSETFDRRKKEIEIGLNGRTSWKTIFLGSTISLGILVRVKIT